MSIEQMQLLTNWPSSSECMRNQHCCEGLSRLDCCSYYFKKLGEKPGHTHTLTCAPPVNYMDFGKVLTVPFIKPNESFCHNPRV